MRRRRGSITILVAIILGMLTILGLTTFTWGWETNNQMCMDQLGKINTAALNYDASGNSEDCAELNAMITAYNKSLCAENLGKLPLQKCR